MKETLEQTAERVFGELLETCSADQITFVMIADRAGITRQAIYYHYSGKRDLVSAYIQNMLARILEGYDTYHSWVEGFRMVLEHFQADRTRVDHIYFSRYRDDFLQAMNVYGNMIFQRAVDHVSNDFNYPVKAEDRHFMVRFYCYVFIGLICDYIEAGMQEDPMTIAVRSNIMMHHSIRTSLRKFNEQSLKQAART